MKTSRLQPNNCNAAGGSLGIATLIEVLLRIIPLKNPYSHGSHFFVEDSFSMPQTIH